MQGEYTACYVAILRTITLQTPKAVSPQSDEAGGRVPLSGPALRSL